MESGIYSSPKSKLRKNKHQAFEEKALSIIAVHYLGELTLLLKFSNEIQKRLDFLPIFKSYLKGNYQQFIKPSKFKHFILANGNISWGKNEDVIFPVSFLYNHPKAKREKEEVLYVL